MTLNDHGGEREIESDQVLWIEWSGEKKTEQTVINNNEKSVAIHHQATDLDLLIFFNTSFPYSFFPRVFLFRLFAIYCFTAPFVLSFFLSPYLFVYNMYFYYWWVKENEIKPSDTDIDRTVSCVTNL